MAKSTQENIIICKNKNVRKPRDVYDGKTVTYKGHIQVKCKGHPRADNRDYVREHILVFENTYNCSVLKWADVHHINGIKDDNRPENLECMIHGKHSSLTHTSKRNSGMFKKGQVPWNKKIF
jgi:hypothetical protein